MHLNIHPLEDKTSGMETYFKMNSIRRIEVCGGKEGEETKGDLRERERER